MPIPSKSGILTHKSIKKAQSLSIKVIEGETVVHGAKIHKSNSFFDTLKVLEDIQSKRTIASTFMNSKSTRAHLILTLKTFWRNGVASKLTFADLAGSERLGRNALGMESPQKDELRSINLSLTALNDVFEAIRKKSKFIPYRNSKLTYLLQDTLVPCDDPSRKGGSAIMICHISTSPAQLKETLCSLQFAVRSRGISLLQSRPNIADATKSISKGLTNEAELEKTRVRLSTALKRIEELETKLRQANRKLLFEQDKNKKNHHSVKSRADTAWCLPRSPIPRFMTPTRTKYTSLSNKNAKLSPVRFWED